METCTYGSEASSWKPTVVIRQGAGYLAYVENRCGDHSVRTNMIIPSIFRALRLVRTVYAGRFCIPVLPKHTLTFTDRGDVASVKIICIMIIGYLRVSMGKQHLANQQDEIRRFAESRNLVVDHLLRK